MQVGNYLVASLFVYKLKRNGNQTVIKKRWCE